MEAQRLDQLKMHVAGPGTKDELSNRESQVFAIAQLYESSRDSATVSHVAAVNRNCYSIHIIARVARQPCD